MSRKSINNIGIMLKQSQHDLPLEMLKRHQRKSQF